MHDTKIGLDCRLSGVQHGGIGRYENEVFSRILTEKRYRFFVYIHDKTQRHALAEKVSGNDSHIIWRVTPITHYSVAEQVQWPRILAQDALDLLHVPHFNAPIFYQGKTVVTIHDLLWHEQKGAAVTTLPAWQYWPKYAAYKYVATQAIKKASQVLVPSQVIKNTVSSLLPGSHDKITVTYEGIGPRFKPNPAIKRKTNHLLYVGSLYPHKNVSLLLHALPKVPEHHLTIISSRNVFATAMVEQAKKLGVEHQVTFLFSLSDTALIQAYQQSSALIQPSLSEGFGLTGVEALACHTPVLASDIPIFREVYGKHATYFSPKSVDAFIAALRSQNPLDTAAVTKHLQRYNWDTTAKQTLDTYHRALNSVE